jgi:hypothetical protein
MRKIVCFLYDSISVQLVIEVKYYLVVRSVPSIIGGWTGQVNKILFVFAAVEKNTLARGIVRDLFIDFLPRPF